MPAETELVIALSRAPISREARDRGQQVLERGINWDVVLPLARKWQVEPTVFGNLGLEFGAAMPPDVHDKIADLERAARAHAISRTLILIDLVEYLASSNIPVIVLKGPAIAIAAYDDFSRRTFADVDLLLHRTDLATARDLLTARGYIPTFHPAREARLIGDQHALEFSDSRAMVELHWTLLSRHLRFNITVDDLWGRSVVRQCASSEIRTLAPEHLFLYLCAHGAKHEWSLFRWICDIAQLAQRLTPSQAETIVALADRANARRIVALGLNLIRAFFGEESSPFPPRAFGRQRDTAMLVDLVKARLTLSGVVSRGILPPRVARIHPYMEPLAFWLRSRERLTDRVACAAQFVFLPAAGDSGEGQTLRFLRPVRLAANALRRLARAS